MSNSESENDLFTNSVLTFQNRGTTICAKGPNINTIIPSLRFHNNTATSIAPFNVVRSRYAESVCDSRSMYHRREREMSCYSASDRFQPRNFHNSYYPSGNSTRSVYNGRSGSPASVRTIDSDTSLSASDIAFAFKNGSFNKYDFHIIKNAYNQFMKGRARKRIKKKRNLRTFLKGFRRRSGGDSGDQASNSSISSDDCRSVRSSKTNYKENISSCRSTRTDISNFRSTMKQSNMVTDCTDNIRWNSFKNVVSTNSQNESSQYNVQNIPVVPQRDRFRSSSFLLPSQRFNQSTASMSILEKSRLHHINEEKILDTRPVTVSNEKRQAEQRNHMTDSEPEEIFSSVTVMEKTAHNNTRKRYHDSEETGLVSDKKRCKLSSSQLNSIKPKTPIANGISKQKPNDFVFAKPKLPIKRPGIVKNQQKINPKSFQTQDKPASKVTKDTGQKVVSEPQAVENLISKSQDQLVEKIISSSKQAEEKLLESSVLSVKNLFSKSQPPADKMISKGLPLDSEQTPLEKMKLQEKEQCSKLEMTDLSMRPSFIKRKLFSQKVDVAEKNSSSENIQADSPHNNIYSKILKEKNRTRKLATQSCLSRDIFGDDNNLLDLIHKVVPADRMNLTVATNRTLLSKNKSKSANADKWDVTGALTSCNEDELSDTYTDEDIFTATKSDKQQAHKVLEKQQTTIKKPKKSKIIPNSNVYKTKNQIGPEAVENKTKISKVSVPIENKGVEVKVMTKSTNIYKCVKSFWSTDEESEIEETVTRPEPGKQNTSIPSEVKKPAVKNRNCYVTVHKMTTNSLENEIRVIEKPKRNPIKDKIDDKVYVNNTETKNIPSKEEKTVKNAILNEKSVTKNTKTSSNTNNKTLNTKEKKPKSSNLNIKSLKTKEKKPMSPKATKKSGIKSTITKINNNNTILSTRSLNLNSTLRPRPQRKKKVNKCCEELEKQDPTLNTSITLYRTLRSRQVNLSMSPIEVNDKAKNKKNKQSATHKKIACHKQSSLDMGSDISFTLTPKSIQSSIAKKTSANIQNKLTERKTRQSDVSFTLLSDNSLNNTVSTRSSSRRKIQNTETLQIQATTKSFRRR